MSEQFENADSARLLVAHLVQDRRTLRPRPGRDRA